MARGLDALLDHLPDKTNNGNVVAVISLKMTLNAQNNLAKWQGLNYMGSIQQQITQNRNHSQFSAMAADLLINNEWNRVKINFVKTIETKDWEERI